ncbi:NUDIX hydrolase [Inhella proteolytica]|uniref:NUDIX hydrolase n=1 Tax=Inhella proteolytica TaxID=2795029 RepID=A0A931IXW5_9BURK|nr:NUDIX hydrolase [Inhella proteolytica]MBH9575754.1 NUDIX hydrolase [Inhella proteolytica]
MKFCPECTTPLADIEQLEDGGPKTRLRCPACGFTHWNNPTPVLAAVVECTDREGQLLLARNAAWPGRFFGLITGFMEAGETPEDGILREVAEETGLQASAPPRLLGVWDFQKKNQLIVAYHVPTAGEIVLSPELAEYKLIPPDKVRCWPQGTGQALATYLRQRGIEPEFFE